MRSKTTVHTLSTPTFETTLPQPDLKIDIFVILNILLVIGMYLLLNSKIFLPAGVCMELPHSEHVQRAAVSHIITVKAGTKENKLLILDDKISSINSLKRDLQLQDSQKNHQNYESPILLRVDRSTTFETIVKISNIIKDAGYIGVELALNKAN